MTMSIRLSLLATVVASLLAFPSTVSAATPPTLINYQGVLRSSTNAPLSGSFDMVFRFFHAAAGGEEILVDSHTTGSGGQVSVSGGLFNVDFGAGTVVDGSGSGTYTSLSDVFRDYGVVFVEIKVGSETLTPRIRVVSSAYALNAANLGGKRPNEFVDTSSAPQTKAGQLTVVDSAGRGIDSTGNETGGFFRGATGVYGEGASGGFFQDSVNPACFAWVASGNVGIRPYGDPAGYFTSSDGSAYTAIASGGAGIDSSGTTNGGSFRDLNGSGYAALAEGDIGIRAFGQYEGGIFSNLGVYASAILGVNASGSGVGIDARGSSYGGVFFDQAAATQAYLASAGEGIGVKGIGGTCGGNFGDSNSSSYALVGYDTYKITGIGSNAFVQNHPVEKDKVIVYNSPEGDEVGVYTRGTARLTNGEAHVPLGSTFAWVTNPDIGLTTQLTPRGEWADLYVLSVTPKELVVKSKEAHSNAVFDYIVHGLRIGFEEVSIVQEKQRESFIPSMADHRKRYDEHPQLRAFDALERFKAMDASAGISRGSDRSFAHARALEAAIHEYDPAVDGPVEELLGYGPPVPVAPSPIVETKGSGGAPPATIAPVCTSPSVSKRSPPPGEPGTRPAWSEGTATSAPDPRGSATGFVLMTVDETIEPGDVIVADVDHGGAMRLASTPSDPAVVGVAVGPSFEGKVPVALSGIVACRVDASFGAVKVGDLLVASPTAGHAMRVDAAKTAPGTILGKALEPLEDGTRPIRVLVMLR